MSDHHLYYALDAKGEETIPEMAHKYEHYECAECKEALTFCKGEVVRPYFRHKASAERAACTYGANGMSKGESIQHRRAKLLFTKHVNQWSVERTCDVCSKEHSIPHPFQDGIVKREQKVLEYRADVVVEQPGRTHIVEICYKHPVTPDKLIALQKTYGSNVYEFSAESILDACEQQEYVLHDSLPIQERCATCVSALDAFHQNPWSLPSFSISTQCLLCHRSECTVADPHFDELLITAKHDATQIFDFTYNKESSQCTFRQVMDGDVRLVKSIDRCTWCTARLRAVKERYPCFLFCSDAKCRGMLMKERPRWSEDDQRFHFPNGTRFAMSQVRVEEQKRRLTFTYSCGDCEPCTKRKERRPCWHCRAWRDMNDMFQQGQNWSCPSHVKCVHCQEAFTTVHGAVHSPGGWKCKTCATGVCDTCQSKGAEQAWCSKCLAHLLRVACIVTNTDCTNCKMQYQKERKVVPSDGSLLLQMGPSFRNEPHQAQVIQHETVSSCRRCPTVEPETEDYTPRPRTTAIPKAPLPCRACGQLRSDDRVHCEKCRTEWFQNKQKLSWIGSCAFCSQKTKSAEVLLTEELYEKHHSQLRAFNAPPFCIDEGHSLFVHHCTARRKLRVIASSTSASTVKRKKRGS